MYRVVIAMRAGLPSALLACLLSACSFAGDGPPQPHFSQFRVPEPKGNTVTVCSAYGCKVQTKVKLRDSDIIGAGAEMRRVMRGSGPVEERRGLAYALAYLEKRIGPMTGTETDRASLDYSGSGDPTQQDCVDESTNATSYMLLLEARGLLKHHRVLRPMSKGVLIDGRWPHYFAIIEEKRTGVKWAVDTFVGPNGARPVVMEAERYYGPG